MYSATGRPIELRGTVAANPRDVRAPDGDPSSPGPDRQPGPARRRAGPLDAVRARERVLTATILELSSPGSAPTYAGLYVPVGSTAVTVPRAVLETRPGTSCTPRSRSQCRCRPRPPMRPAAAPRQWPARLQVGTIINRPDPVAAPLTDPAEPTADAAHAPVTSRQRGQLGRDATRRHPERPGTLDTVGAVTRAAHPSRAAPAGATIEMLIIRTT